MAEIADVTPTAVIDDAWGNAIRNRSIQRYDDTATRAAENTSPTNGDLAFMEDTGDIDVYFSGAWRHVGDSVGTIKMHGGGSVPTGWLVCNGSAVSRTTYAGLFLQIGITWGAGDGSTTFNLPDLRGRVPRGVAASGTGDAVGETFGSDTHTHTGPSHSHAFSDTSTSEGSHDHALEGGYAKWATQPTETQFTRISTENYTINRNTGTSTNLLPNTVSATTDAGTALGGDTQSGGVHNHAVAGTTEAGGTGNTGSSSTIQAGAAVVFLIKT